MATAQRIGTPKAKSDAGIGSSLAAWREFGEKMAQAAAMNAVHLEPRDGMELQKRFLESLEQLKGEAGDETIRRHGEELTAELERHKRATQHGVTKAIGELRETVAALSAGLRVLTGDSEVASQIEALHTAVTTAKTPGELEAGRAQIEELVALVREKERARAARGEEFARELQRRIQQLDPASAGAGAKPAAVVLNDALTGLPNGVAAREAILSAQSAEHPPVVAVMHIQSLDVLHARFGQRIGDQVVLTCCQRLASHLGRKSDRFFRWDDPTFVALLDRNDSQAGVGREVSHACNSIGSSFFSEQHRNILIPIKMVSTTLDLESRLVMEVFDSVERFVLRSGRIIS